MKFFIYLIWFMIQLGESQPLWKEVYNTKNWFDIYRDKTEGTWFCFRGCWYQYCKDSQILGAFYIKGIISSTIKLPAHTSIKVTFDYWIYPLQGWQQLEYLADNLNQFISTNYDQRQDICGSQTNPMQNITITLSTHLSSSLNFFLKQNYSSNPIYYFGLNNFKIEIEECPDNCTFCQDSTFSCKQWIHFASYFSNQNEFDGWQIDSNQTLGYNECNFNKLAGGINNLSKGQSMEKLIQNLPRHFKVHIVVKLWIFGMWNEKFDLEIDNQLIYSTTIHTLDLNTTIFCQSIKQKIFNIDGSTNHTSPEILIKMKSQNDQEYVGYWGVSSLDLYVAQCSDGCEDCYYNGVYKCIRCIKKLRLLNGECVPEPPLKCSYLNINQVISIETNSISPFELKIIELNLIMREIDQIQQIVDIIISKISIQIQVQCQEKMQISSFFRTCDGCEGQQCSFYNYCPSQRHIFNYNATFPQDEEYEIELLITMSQSKIEIVQVQTFDGVKKQVLILKIEI